VFKTIVVGLDGSDGAERAIPFAVGLARREGAKLIIAHIEEDIVGKGGGPIHATEDETQAEIDRKAEELSSQGIQTSVKKTSVMLGGPAPAIARIADQVDAELIVVGSRGHSALAGVLLGSVAQRLLHHARVPVLVVPSEAVPAGDQTDAASADPAQSVA